MHLIAVLAVLPGLLFAVESLPSSLSIIKRHHVVGRSSAQLGSLNIHNNNEKYLIAFSGDYHHHREPREVRFLQLKDPLDCLSQVVCGLNTYPPQQPSVRTSTANDFAFLLKNAVSKLRSQKVPTTTTTTTVAPATKRTTETPAEDDDDYDDETNEVDYEENDAQEYYDDNDDDDRLSPPGRAKRVKRYSIFNKRNGQSKKKMHKKKNTKSKKAKKSTIVKNLKGKNQPFKKFPPNVPRPLTALDRLRMETDLRAKLLSDAQCVNGLIDHSCPFNYQQMLVLISSSLERERTISYTSNKVLPMVGYLIKSRNYTGTLQATFLAIERINNYTIESDRDGKPIDFTHILDEVMNRATGDNGLRIVDTSNDSASASVWEDDEFDHILQNPYERKKPHSDNYKLAKKRDQELNKTQTNKGSGLEQTADDDQSTTSEEDTSEEGLVFDRPRPPPHGVNGPGDDGDSSSEEDEVNQGKKKEKKKITGTGFGKQSNVPGPVFGFNTHLQKSAEDE